MFGRFHGTGPPVKNELRHGFARRRVVPHLVNGSVADGSKNVRFEVLRLMVHPKQPVKGLLHGVLRPLGAVRHRQGTRKQLPAMFAVNLG